MLQSEMCTIIFTNIGSQKVSFQEM
ncbi:hypothetical protein Pint_31370 [Pistacia integerrima]|uniref:Uncharacterized protein n=1 Tax=Pistacia integerrima TaxID=434235 RepID=A0ACC0XNX4_9ROSI|nr:hypothetical protein Pint_31370 [Pistacia integerrima]